MWSDRLFRSSLATSAFENITYLFPILPPPRAWILARPGHARPQCFGDSRDSKNDSIFGARREIQRRRRHAPSCMGATELQSNWPEMRKTLGKPGFCSGEDRNRTFGCLPWFLKSSRDGDKSLRSQKTMHRTGNLFSITEQSEQRHH